MTEREIEQALHMKSTEAIIESANCTDMVRKQHCLLQAMHCSIAGWILAEATDEQVLAIFEQYRPAQDRN